MTGPDPVQDIGRALVAAAPAGWQHLRGEFRGSGRGKAFAATPNGPMWLDTSGPVRDAVARYRATSGQFTRLQIDVDPGGPAVAEVTHGGGAKRARLMLATLTALGAAAAAVMAAIVVLRPAPEFIPSTVEAAPGPAEIEARRLVEAWYDDRAVDPQWLRPLVCATPSGQVAEDLARAESGAANIARYRVEGFTDFVDNGSTAQIRVYTTASALTPEAAEQIAARKEGFFIWTYVFAKENGQLRMCGG